MIVQIRGNSGSGKSHLVREYMSRHGTFVPQHVVGRKRPLWYHNGMVAVVGSYENACGGCDTISGYDTTYGLISMLAEEGFDVLYEGLLLSEETKRAIALHAVDPATFRVLYLDLPLSACLAGIAARRAARDPNLPPVNPANTTRRHNTIMRATAKLRAAGVHVESLSRAEAAIRLEELS